MLIISHKDCYLKDNGLNHPERKDRLTSIIKSIKEITKYKIKFKNAPLAELQDISLVHPLNHIEKIFAKIPKQGFVGVESEPYADTILCPNSKNAILRSCGAGILAADNLIENREKKIFCAIRPPGHHAETTRANGFCFINNIAVTARYLQKKHQIKKIAIIDFDVHHGNGTQEIFYKDKNIIYGSIHEHPLFPGTGLEEEKGTGNILNAPIKAGTVSDDFIDIFTNKILSKIDKFKPEVILISAGFDAHIRDPLANINLTSKDFFEITKRIVKLANIHSDGRIISFLEGGYDLTALSESIKEHLNALNYIK
jgi:acetoin utilization deacetylase AcuC-like enzyme